MTLPQSRDFTAPDSGRLPAHLINALQDSVVTGAHGVLKLGVMAGSAYDISNAAFVGFDRGIGVDGTGDPSWSLKIPIPLPARSVIVDVEVFGTAPTSNMNLNVGIATLGFASLGELVVAVHATATFSAGASFTHLIDDSVGSTNKLPYTIQDNEAPYCVIQDGATQPAETYDIWGIAIRYYKP